jgi:hypothetical protein
VCVFLLLSLLLSPLATWAEWGFFFEIVMDTDLDNAQRIRHRRIRKSPPLSLPFPSLHH